MKDVVCVSLVCIYTSDLNHCSGASRLNFYQYLLVLDFYKLRNKSAIKIFHLEIVLMISKLGKKKFDSKENRLPYKMYTADGIGNRFYGFFCSKALKVYTGLLQPVEAKRNIKIFNSHSCSSDKSLNVSTNRKYNSFWAHLVFTYEN